MSDDSECWLCGRELGQEVEWHHPVPKSRGGRVKVPLHPICHRTIHASFTNSQLGRMGADVEAVRDHEEIAGFIRWIAKKPPDFHAPTRKAKP